MTNLHAVRVTQEPGVVRNVDSAEFLDLARQGFIHSYEHTDEAAAVLERVPGYKAPAKWKAPSKGEDVVEAGPAMTDPVAANADNKKGE